MPRKPVPCPICGRARKTQTRPVPCWDCRQFGRGKHKPLDDQQIKLTPTLAKLALLPKGSWWAVSSREAFMENQAQEADRLHRIGADLRREGEA